ncbi:MAG: hypothetical protein DMG79_14490 [Acidobacteria bacterium]|nr:MAG: hypothetical protein DMG79_14490 [Acidobacteriota bacterium]
MPSPQRQERRDLRYPLHLPVLIRMAQRKEMHTRSENISLGGILLSSSFLIPEGSAVEVSIGVQHLPDPGILMSARGKVLRVLPKETGDFSVAIKLDEAFTTPLSESQPPSDFRKQSTILTALKKKPILNDGMQLALAWETET